MGIVRGSAARLLGERVRAHLKLDRPGLRPLAPSRCQAVGRAVGKSGAVKYRGAIYFYSKSRKLSPLNKMATVMEYDIAADGTTVTKLWEWK